LRLIELNYIMKNKKKHAIKPNNLKVIDK